MSVAASQALRAIQVLQVVSLRVQEQGESARYRSRILDFTPSRDVVIEAPSNLGEEIDLTDGDSVGLEIALPDGVWLYDTRVVGRPPLATRAIRLAWPERTDRIQRRDNARVECELRAEVRFTVLDEERRAVPRTLEGITVDLSAGGVRLRLPEPLEVNRDVELRVYASEGELVECEARVVRGGDYIDAQGRTRYWIAAECINISGAALRRLTRLVFELDCERRRARVE